jgi:prepilin-type N-terminal cleavage/methylation domain-containing protein
MLATGRSADSGMTLMEVLVVVAISVLISTIAFPRLERLITSVQFRQSSTLLAAHLRMAQARAWLQQIPIAVAISPDGRSYAWTGGQAQTLPENVTLRSSKAEPVVFFPDSSTQAAEWTLTQKRQSRTFTIAAATGAVTLK